MNGFHLIELLITLVIISILAAISWPMYSVHIEKERRLEAATALMKLAGVLEEYHLQHDTYEAATLEKLHFAESVGNYYRLEIRSVEEGDFSLVARSLKKDGVCQELTLNAVGEKGVLGTGKSEDCW